MCFKLRRFEINALSNQDKLSAGRRLLILVLIVVCQQPFLVFFFVRTARTGRARENGSHSFNCQLFSSAHALHDLELK